MRTRSHGTVAEFNDGSGQGVAVTYGGPREHAVPRALGLAELPRVVADYAAAARAAMHAGFDGVEVHAAHGYLLDQFLSDGVNTRTDGYGGGAAQRCRLLLEVVQAVAAVCGAGRVGVRLSPTLPGSITYYGTTTSDHEQVYGHAVKALDALGLAYLLLTEPRWAGREGETIDTRLPPLYRRLWRGVLIGSSGFTPASAAEAVAAGQYDAIAFGRWFISNPDLPLRIRRGLPLSRYDRSTFYGGGEEGYTDYPAHDQGAPSRRGTVAKL